ncbi:alpha/beta hydrolase [Actinotalea sp. C106]|uniref:alpha/beta hydrolase n=1 Tax=Actinotalea sp. C106 TaxID=2908644 RepID=UPI00202872A7|nr:alpha/beta hydrolase [Actinotalea sp. C106]
MSPGAMAGGVPTGQASAWHPDVLGEGWEALTVPLLPDDQGEAVTTLVRRVRTEGEPRRRRAVLYVHGYVDYFFQRHLAEVWEGAGFDFYALDLRNHGRSMLPHQQPNAVTDIALHAEELDRAVAVVRAEGHEVVVGHGHSTGGLVLSLWAHARRDRPQGPVVDALVLNSPWFDLNRSRFDRVVTTAALEVVGGLAPRLVVGQLAPHYGRHLHVGTGGRWDYDLAWKPHDGFGVRAGWMRSIRRGHRAVARGLVIDVPVLVCASSASGPHDRWHDSLDRTDSVLDVDQIIARAPGLGPDVTVVQVTDGVHDLILSAEPARQAYADAVTAWLARRLPA